MKAELLKYSGMNICVALSGGRDSMALAHYLAVNGAKYGITVCAVNFDHKIRGESSARDSSFVKDYCGRNGIPLLFFEWTENVAKTEASARAWRLEKYAEAAFPHKLPDGTEWKGADAIATAHHLNDNAETVIFNLARGSGLSGLTGIKDEEFATNGKRWKLIRPFAEVSRGEIDGYVLKNRIPYVDDETNFMCDYTRNKIRRNVLPELEKAVPGAAKAIYRFSRVAAEDEEYFGNIIEERGLVKKTPSGYEIGRCGEKAVFKRAVLKVFCVCGIRDYNSAWLNALYGLQFAENGKKFQSAGFTAYCEDGKIAICTKKRATALNECAVFADYFSGGLTSFCGQTLQIFRAEDFNAGDFDSRFKALRFDSDKIPQNAVLRFMRAGDVFEKFGGGTKNLGSYFTDVKIPARVRGYVPVVAAGNRIYVVCGTEISKAVKVDDGTVNEAVLVAENYSVTTRGGF